MTVRRKPLTEEIEAFALRSIRRHTTERNFEAVAEVFEWIGRFHEMHEQDQPIEKEKTDAHT